MPQVLNRHHFVRLNAAPPDAVYIGRGSPWGNPFHIGKDGTRAQVIDRYKREVLRRFRRADLEVLRGRDLICFCAPQPCHGDALLWKANYTEPKNLHLAIVGQQIIEDSEEVRELIDDRICTWAPAVFISGGAKGVDSIAEAVVRDKYAGYCIPAIYKPEIERWDDSNTRIGFRTRNIRIAQACDVLVRICQKNPSPNATYGSGWTADFAERIGKYVEEIAV